MGNKYVVDTAVIETAIVDLRKLKTDCQNSATKKLPKAGSDKGKTHNEIVNMHKQMINSFNQMELLIDKTITFLNGEIENVETNDKNAANKIAV